MMRVELVCMRPESTWAPSRTGGAFSCAPRHR